MNNKTPKMGLWMLTALVAGNMIGSGIFLLPASLSELGTVSIASWIVTLIGAMILAYIFSCFSIAIPKAGGPYIYTKNVLGDFLGFQTAFFYWFAAWVGNAAIVLALVGYLSVFIPWVDSPAHTCIVSISFVWCLTLVNILSVKIIGGLQVITTVLKLIPLLVIASIGWLYVHPENFTQFVNISEPHVSNLSAVNAGVALTFWSFIGLESATLPAGLVDNPKRNIPRATLFGTLIAGIVYVISCSAVMGIVPATELQDSVAPFALAAEKMFGHLGGSLMAAGAVIACFGALSGWILLQGQVGQAAADDKLFPKIFAKRNKNDIPASGIVITSIFISILLLLTISDSLIKQFELIILITVFTTLVPYLYTALSYLIINKKPTPIIVGLIACVYVLRAIWGSGETVMFYGSLLFIFSVVMYAIMKRKNNVD